MKKTLLLTASFLSAFALMACTASPVKESDTKQTEKVSQSSSSQENQKESPNKLTKVGQKISDPTFGTVELAKITYPNQEVDFGNNVKGLIKVVRLIKVSKIDETVKSQLQTQENEGYIIQITTDFENQNDVTVANLSPVGLVLSNGQQIPSQYLNSATPQVFSKATLKDLITVYYIGKEETDSVRMLYNYIYAPDNLDLKFEPVETTVKF